MKTRRTKQEQFVIDISHAFVKYGLAPKGEDCSSFFPEMVEALNKNLPEIRKLSYQLEFVYTED